MRTEPLVTVIIATYNRAEMLPDAIRSVLAQTYSNKQIIVVDDASTDNTREVVKAFPEVSYILQPHGRQAAARNNGWRHANGTSIATLDSDDRWDRQFLEKCISKVEREKMDFVFANWDQQTPEGKSFDFLSNDPLLKPYLHRAHNSWVNLDHNDLRELYLKGCPSPSSSLVIRAASLGGWNEAMIIGDDWCMLLDMIMSGKCTAAFTLEQLWHKNINCDNIYDGRDHVEVNRLLYVEDICTLMNRYAGTLTKDEYKDIERKYLKNLVRSAKHSMFHYSNFSEGVKLMTRAVSTNPVYTARIFMSLFVDAGKRHISKERRNVTPS